MACPTPSHKRRQPTGTRPAMAGDLIQPADFVGSGSLPPVVSRHATASTVPRVQGEGRPPGQATGKGQHHDRAECELAGNLTDQLEVRYTEGGIARAMFQVAVSGGREQEASFFTVVVWRDQAEHVAESLAKGSRVVVVGRLSSGPGRLRMAAPGPRSRCWPRSWGRASLVHLRCGACLECRRTPGAVGPSPPSLAWIKAERSSRGPTVRDALSGNRATR